ncbi:MBL fold metallo-hydrolase [Oricola nitratireducens]|jgi:glyoxylase-like metal-dependent hydrolase (beta-lactamase superfamily II)|uniref:MBL fold metallo-hydrolase n=1 Tax=Oricola nitratireducens TaxID=2775868 RepID=UPI001867DC71|nr:MBL fold metallo-hydrolase [Oricola nitratireducens]
MSLKKMTRREALAVLGVASALPFVPGMSGRAVADIALGSKTVTTVSDGNLVLPLDFAFPDVPREDLIALLEAAGLGTDAVEPPCNVTVLKDGDRVVLFDVGSGPNFMPSAGKILDNIDAAGIAPEDVTDVVFTHAHPDHIWGLLDDFDEFIFPEANYFINQVEWDYWRADDTLAKMPEARKTFVVGAQNRLAALEDVISFFNYGDEVLPGIEAIDTAGHTPGHTSFAIHDGSDSVTVIGDAATSAVISFAHPEWPSGSDQDTEMGIATRTKLLDRLAQEQTRFIGFHLPEGGIGRVEKDGTAYRFVAA